MPSVIGEWLTDALLAAGVGLYETVSNDQIEQILAKSRPVSTQHELIRIGATADGGYLVPDDLDGIKYCFSPGVADTAKFEEALAARGIKSYMADYAVDAPPTASDMFVFDKKYLGAYSDDIYFTLGTWIEKYLPQGEDDLILQMDIEGSEYPVLCETPESTLKRFRIIVIEFHHLNRLFEKNFLQIYTAAINKLTRHFHCVHVHPNNRSGLVSRAGLEIPRVMEFTFLRKERVSLTHRTRSYPHPLDVDCEPGRKGLRLPRCWQ